MTVNRFLLLLVAAMPMCVLAQGVAIKPGKWEFTTTTTSGLDSEPTVNVAQQCMTGEPYNPAAKLTGDCQVTDQKLNGNRLTWQVSCATQLGSADGAGEFKATDTQADGFLNMMMHYDGQDIPVKTAWQGKYLGACDS